MKRSLEISELIMPSQLKKYTSPSIETKFQKFVCSIKHKIKLKPQSIMSHIFEYFPPEY